MLQENSPNAACMSIRNVSGVLVYVLAVYASWKFVTRELFFFLVSCYDDDSARALGMQDVDGWEKINLLKNTYFTLLSVEHGLKWQQRDGCFRSRQSPLMFRTKNKCILHLDRGPS